MLVPPPKTVLESNILYGVKGAESFHIYICAAKDLCWTQDA